MVNNNEFDLVCESAKGDQHREMISYKTVVESIGSGEDLALTATYQISINLGMLVICCFNLLFIHYVSLS